MANPTSGRSDRNPSQTSTQTSGTPAKRSPFPSTMQRGAGSSPFSSLFHRWNEEMDRMFENFGFGRGSIARGEHAMWAPEVEVFQRGHELVVRADLPGMNKEDVHVDIADDVLTIQGERKQERDEEREGWYQTERSYGSFYRTVPLPDGTITDSAKASFKNGVLEVVLQAPPHEVSRGRRINVD